MVGMPAKLKKNWLIVLLMMLILIPTALAISNFRRDGIRGAKTITKTPITGFINLMSLTRTEGCIITVQYQDNCPRSGADVFRVDNGEMLGRTNAAGQVDCSFLPSGGYEIYAKYPSGGPQFGLNVFLPVPGSATITNSSDGNCPTTTTTTTSTTTTTTPTTTTSTTTKPTTTTTKSTTTSTTTTTTIKKRSSGGCPILKVYQDNKLTTIGKLNIHSPKDQDVITTSTFTMQQTNGKYEIILDEAAYLFWDGSHINSVKLTDETEKECKLVSATHSKQGDVLSAITTSDDVRVRSYPGERIKLVYDDCSGNQFTFSIEGYNMKTPLCPVC